MKHIVNNSQYNEIKNKIVKTCIKENNLLTEWKEGRGYIDVYKKNVERNNKKAIIFVHGGSFLYESPREEPCIFFCYMLCNLTGYDIYAPDFVLPPVKSYPSQIDDIMNLKKFLDKQYQYIIIGGDSSGGCITMSTLIKYYNDFSSGFLISPWLNLNCNTSSYKTRTWCENMKTGDPIFKLSPRKNSAYFIKDATTYLNDVNLFNNKIANPYYATSSVLSKIPPLLILVGDSETIRNDSIDFASRAQKVNKNIFISMYDNMWHDWLLYRENSSGKRGLDAFGYISSFCKGVKKDNLYNFDRNHIISKLNLEIIL